MQKENAEDVSTEYLIKSTLCVFNSLIILKLGSAIQELDIVKGMSFLVQFVKLIMLGIEKRTDVLKQKRGQRSWKVVDGMILNIRNLDVRDVTIIISMYLITMEI